MHFSMESMSINVENTVKIEYLLFIRCVNCMVTDKLALLRHYNQDDNTQLWI